MTDKDQRKTIQRILTSWGQVAAMNNDPGIGYKRTSINGRIIQENVEQVRQLDQDQIDLQQFIQSAYPVIDAAILSLDEGHQIVIKAKYRDRRDYRTCPACQALQMSKNQYYNWKAQAEEFLIDKV